MKKIIAITCAILLSLTACTQQNIDVEFSPGKGAESLVLQTIDSAKNNIRLAAYSFTSPQVVKALIEAKRRGVDIKIVIDEKGNKSQASKAAMNLIVNAGIPLRTISKYKIHHDKYIIVDNKHLETGSFNYSQSAAKSNSENVIVVWNSPDIANKYLEHWQSRWDDGRDWKSAY